MDSSKNILFDASSSEELKNQKQTFVEQYCKNQLPTVGQHNAVIYHNNKKYIILDTDDKIAYKFVKKILEKFNIKKSKTFYTHSISQYLKFNDHGYHFYFSFGKMEISSNKIGLNKSKLDILVNQKIFENSHDFERLNIDEFPTMTQEIYDEICKISNGEIEIPKVAQEIKGKPNNKGDIEFLMKHIDPSRFFIITKIGCISI